jgi:hypothetical protein
LTTRIGMTFGTTSCHGSRMIGIVLCTVGLSAASSAQRPQATRPASAPGQNPPTLTIKLGPAIPQVFGGLAHCPNGHISFIKQGNTYRIWVAGNTDSKGNAGQGSYFYTITGWTATNLQQARQTFALGPTRGTGTDFDRDYAALNAVIEVPGANTLLGIYDAEFHPRQNFPNALLSSIGMATSTDGVHWTKNGQVIQGIDEATYGQSKVAAMLSSKTAEADGSSGPSAVIRSGGVGDGSAQFIYVYYADRDPIVAKKPVSNVYVARAPLTSKGKPGSWQKWNGTRWGAAGDQLAGVPVVTPARGEEAVQPQVTWNPVLSAYLMIFKGGNGFYATTSKDGLKWASAILFVPFDLKSGGKTAYPSFVSPSSSSQETTGENGIYYYAIRGKAVGGYVGMQRTMTVGSTVSRGKPPNPRGELPPGRKPSGHDRSRGTGG